MLFIKSKRYAIGVQPWLVFCIAVLVGCTRPATLQELPPDAVILAFGDSLTYGTGAPAEQSYPAILQQLTGLTVIRSGVPGEVTADGLKRLGEVLEKTRPQLLILCHGGNDFLRKRNPAETRRNIAAMIALAEQRGIQSVLLGVPKPGLFLSTAQVYQDIAEEMKVPLEGSAIADILSDNRYKSDHVHPNVQGYQKLAEAVYALLRENGAVTR